MRTNSVWRTAALVAITGGLAACATAPTEEEIAFEEELKERSLMPATADQREEVRNADPVTQAAFWGVEFEKSPGDIEAATEFAKALRGMGSEKRAAEVASQALALDPQNVELISILGKSLLSSGDPAKAADVLLRASMLDPYDMTILGALGVAYDQTGRHREAQNTYRRALQSDPNSTSVLSNYGLSLALTGKPEEAEGYLRRATSQPNAGMRERQNLAMVLSLQGKFDEARDVSAADLPDTMVEKNIDYFRSMLTPQQRSWSQLRGTMD